MLFQPENIEIPKGIKQIPLGMIGPTLVELKRDVEAALCICVHPHAEFKVSDETPTGVIKVMEEEVMVFFVKYHRELLYK